uniref:Putative g protein-coupled receptor n=2 Tax=Anopheles triannulatus TaxID=58253 RepID=A0A2M4A1V4_9DIPT
MDGTPLLRCVAIVSLLIAVGRGIQTDTDRRTIAPSPPPPPSYNCLGCDSEPAKPATDAFLTTNKCDDLLLLAATSEWSDTSNLPDCGCPPGYTALLVDHGQVESRTLCAALWSPRPWHEGCVAAGTTTDYFDLPLKERRWVWNLLHDRAVTEFWISARLHRAPGGPLVRRLPGTGWNSPLLEPWIQGQHLELDLNAPTDADFHCAAVDGPDYGRIFLTNCSRALPLLCLVRLPPLTQLHCRKGELTTRYRDSGVQQCYAVLFGKERDRNRWPLPLDYRPFVVDGARKVCLLRELLERTAKHGKRCQTPYYIDTSSGHATGPQAAGTVEQSPHDCLVVQRNAGDGLGTTTAPTMHLHFDKERLKLLLTVYGQRWFWREQQSDLGFTCFTDSGRELLNPVKVRTVRVREATPPPRRRRAHPRGDPVPAGPEPAGLEPAVVLTERNLYELRMMDGQPGQYWCEAHLLPNFTVLVTPATLAYRRVAEGRSFFAIALDAWPPEAGSMMRPKYYRTLVKGALKQHRHLAKVKDVYGALRGMEVRHAVRLRDGGSGQPATRLVLHLAMARIDDWTSGHFTGAWEYEENVIALPEPYLAIYRMRQCLRDVFQLISSSNSRAAPFRLLGVNSTEYCLPDRLSSPPGAVAGVHGNVWWAGRLGETVAPQNLCVVERFGLPPVRRCIGDYLHGCTWDRDRPEPDRFQCAPIQQKTTGALYRYSVAPLNDTPTLRQAFGTIEQVLRTEPTALIPADLFYIAKTLENARGVLQRNGTGDAGPAALLSDPQLYCNLTTIMSRILYVNETVVTVSQRALNTTNILLYATETIVSQLPRVLENLASVPETRYECDRAGAGPPGTTATVDEGTLMFRSARLIVLIADPTVANVSGVALFRTRPRPDQVAEDDFTDYTLRLLFANQSQQALLEEEEEEDLEIGAFIPQSVLDGLAALHSAMQDQEEEPVEETDEQPGEADEEEEIVASTTTTTKDPLAEAPPLPPPPPVHIVIVVYYNDRAFRETRNGTIARPNAKIISVSLPGYGSRLPDEVPIFTREHPTQGNGSKPGNPSSRCGYWSFEARDREEFGRWVYDECRLIGESGVRKLCGCYHLTSFSRLTMDTQLVVESVGVSQKLIADQATYALDVITAIGCSLSLLGVLGIAATATLFPSWRAKASTKILLQLSGAIAIEMIILFVEGPDIDLRRVSRIECALLGSTLHYIILVTFMWMLVTAYLQFQRYVKVVGRLRSAHFILKATALSWGVPLVPVATFLAADHALYLKRDNLSDICYPHGAALWYGLLLPIAAIVLLNLVSFVVVLYHICTIRQRNRHLPGKATEHDLTHAQLRLSVFLFFLLGLPWIFGMLTTGTEEKLFAYLFCLTAPVQGFVLFLYFVVMDPVARRLWHVRLRRCAALATPGRPASSKDTDMEKETTATPSTTLNTQL